MHTNSRSSVGERKKMQPDDDTPPEVLSRTRRAQDGGEEPVSCFGQNSAFSVDSFCAEFGIGRTLAYAEIGAGRLIAQKAGRRTLISRVEAQRWLASLPASNRGARS